MPEVLITGNSSGLGHALSKQLLSRDWRVYGLSRRGCDLTGNIKDLKVDLADLNGIDTALDQLLEHVTKLQLVVLNAGIFGEVSLLSETPQDNIQTVMDVNVWSNKAIIDWLIRHQINVNQLILISSGASVRGSKGWGAYALSKATLNMLAKLYAHEMPKTHIVSLAPGVIDSAMIEYICDTADTSAFPNINYLVEMRNSGQMQSEAESANRILSLLERLTQEPSGSFIDVRQFD